MNLKDISIRWQLLAICILLVSIPVVTLGVLSYNTNKSETEKTIENNLEQLALVMSKDAHELSTLATSKVKSDLNVARHVLLAYGRPSINSQGNFVLSNSLGEHVVNGNYEIVDKVQNLVGGTATIFQLKSFEGDKAGDKTSTSWSQSQAMYRISTNVIKTDGNRAVGTILSKTVYDTVMRGDTFYGKAYVVDQWYLTAYEPIEDSTGRVIGILYVGVPENMFFESFKEELSKLVIGKTGYVFIVNEAGDYVLSYKGQRDGENILESKDANGVSFVKEMINTGKGFDSDDTGIKYYDWKNAGESSSRKKIAAYGYVESLGWILAPSAYQEDFFDGLYAVRNTTIVIVIFSIIIGTIIAYLFALSMTAKFDLLANKMRKVSEGDLTVNLGDLDSGKNEIGQMGVSFVTMTGNLKNLISSILTNASTASSSAQDLSASTEEVNASVQQVSTTIQEIANGAQNLSKDANEVSKQSGQAETSAQQGAKSSGAVSEKMDSIMASTKAGAEKIRALGEKSKKIGDIVEAINNISEQTNLLALNAAIEAARAGEAGRGFAVVADEVRKLAEESQKATGEISGLIGGIQTEISEAVTTMDKNAILVDEGASAVNESVLAFNEIPALVNGVNKSIASVSAVAEENAAGAEEVNASVEQVSSSMQQVAATSEDLSKGAEDLKHLVSKFRV